MWQALAGLAGSALGVLGQRNANRENRLQQEKFASQGIRMRVEDAKQAGLHPLFALGGSVPGYSPSAQNVFDGQAMGQNLARVASHFSQEERDLRAIQLDAARAAVEKDQAMAAAYNAEAAKARQELRVSKPVVTGGDLRDENGALLRETWDTDSAYREYDLHPAPGEQVTKLQESPRTWPAKPPGFLTGTKEPGFTEFGWPSGKGKGTVYVMLPSEKMANSLEGLEDAALQALIVGANVAAYGDDVSAEFRQQLKGIAADWVRAYRSRGNRPPVTRGRLAP